MPPNNLATNGGLNPIVAAVVEQGTRVSGGVWAAQGQASVPCRLVVPRTEGRRPDRVVYLGKLLGEFHEPKVFLSSATEIRLKNCVYSTGPLTRNINRAQADFLTLARAKSCRTVIFWSLVVHTHLYTRVIVVFHYHAMYDSRVSSQASLLDVLRFGVTQYTPCYSIVRLTSLPHPRRHACAYPFFFFSFRALDGIRIVNCILFFALFFVFAFFLLPFPVTPPCFLLGL